MGPCEAPRRKRRGYGTEPRGRSRTGYRAEDAGRTAGAKLRDGGVTHRRPDEKFFLGYFDSAWPPHYGVRPTHFLPAVSYIVRPPHTPYELTPGLYAVSATLLSEVYSPDRGPWTPAMEARWQRFRTTPPTAENFPTYDHLRFTRLCKYLQLRPPEADAGHSILIFRLTPADLRAALDSHVTGAYRLRPD